jgi:membrane-bound serine protease (ClpP class)
VLVLIGLILIALEIFVIPGFGVAGVLGIIAVFAGMFLGLVPHIPEIPTTLPGINAPGIAEYLPQITKKIIFTMVLVIGGVYLLAKLLPKTSVYGHLVLQAELSKDKGYVSSDSHYNDFLGKTGIARTDLHPSGIAMFGDERLDVVTTGDMIEKDAEIKVVQVQGGRIVVEKA